MVTSSKQAKDPRNPRHIDLKLLHPTKTLIAGQTGTVELTARIKEQSPDCGRHEGLNWDWRTKAPLTVWISTPQDSGITFLDKDNPDSPHHHILVRFSTSSLPHSKTLNKKIQYTVAPRTKTGDHAFWLEVSGKLSTQKGELIEDAGIAKVPFMVDTSLSTKLLMLAVVGLVVFLFIMEWVRVDVVAIAMMVLLPELGLLNAQDTFKGLSSNAVMAIIGVMIISYGLNRVGLVQKMLQPILGFVGKGKSRMVITFSSLIAVISSVMQNTGAAVLFLPAIRTVATQKLKVHLSRVLMPIGMAAILGGTLTMIGTSPLILLNDILPPGMAKFGFLELTPIGLAIVVAGIAFLSTLGMRLLDKPAKDAQPGEKQTGKETDQSPLVSYSSMDGPYEILVPPDMVWNHTPPTVSEIQQQFLVNVVAIKKKNGTLTLAPHPTTGLKNGFSLCVYGTLKNIGNFTDTYGLKRIEEPQAFKENLFNHSWAGVLEAVVSPRSDLLCKTIIDSSFGHKFGVTLLALHRGDKNLYQNLGEKPLKAGDILLLHGTWKHLQDLFKLLRGLHTITQFEKEYHRPEKANAALFCFVVSLILMLISSFWFQKLPYNPIPLSICLMAGAVGMMLLKVISVNEAYHAVDWRTVFLLSGLIPLGMAVDQTGTAQWIAKGIVEGLGSFMSPLVLLFVLAGLSCAFTLVISNVGACTLLVPLGISLANHVGIDPRVAAIVVGLGVSNSFILPTHQVNALYMGPGEYVTRDYLKIGGILSVIYIAVLVVMAYLFYM
ncbi:SLC13 family permease [Dethiosulfatarculus sandiegensis]|nr:SLC13 family permease [Dethiosulfatarculus sandiegensis]